MAGRDESLDLTLEIDEAGEVKAVSRSVLRRLAAAAGRYRLLPTIGGVMCWQRLDDAGKPQTPVLLAGEIDGPGAVANVLGFIHYCQWDGTLTLLDGATRKALYFRGGAVMSAASNLPEDRIGAILVRFGLVSEDVLAAAVREVTPQRRLGTILVEKGLVGANDLYEIVKRQVEEIAYSTLLVVRGSYLFTKHGDEPPATRLHLDTQSLLLEGMRRIDEMSWFRAKIPAGDCVLARRHAQAPTPPSGTAAVVWELVDGRRTVLEIAQRTRLGEFATTKAAFELVQTGLIDVLGRAEAAPARQPAEPQHDAVRQLVDAYNTAFTRLYGIVSAKGKGAGFRQGVRAFLGGSARFTELFRDVVFGEDGSLPRMQLLANVDGMSDTARFDLLSRALHELLFFELFVAGDSVSPEEERDIQDRLTRTLAKVPQRASA
jgi:hypothetical protein